MPRTARRRPEDASRGRDAVTSPDPPSRCAATPPGGREDAA
ncbi:hypothetical protein HMPREF0043_00956 [Actinobaculum sp. oral taxon 183 str. F0552]|nr:hypothetical protein HMPREF0043_00956 [Actinobaculum sp. oral taxon 183 str. F0552]